MGDNGTPASMVDAVVDAHLPCNGDYAFQNNV